MQSQPKMFLALFVALAFSFGIPAFAEQEASQPAAPASEQHMGNDHSSAKSTEKGAKPNKMAKKKHMAKKGKKQHKKSGDES